MAEDNIIQPREVQEKETVAGQMKGLLEEESPYVTMARTRAAEKAQQRGMLNTSMGIQAGEAAAIETARPIAERDAMTYADAAKSAQESGYREREMGVEYKHKGALEQTRGAISKDLTRAEYGYKSQMQSQELSARAGMLGMELSAAKQNLATELAANRKLQNEKIAAEFEQLRDKMTFEEQEAWKQDIREKQQLRIKGDYEMAVQESENASILAVREMMEANEFDMNTVREMGDTYRTGLETASNQYMKDLEVADNERAANLRMMEQFGADYQNALTSIAASDLSTTAKGDALFNAVNGYQALVDTTANIAGIPITWDWGEMNMPGNRKSFEDLTDEEKQDLTDRSGNYSGF